VLFVVGPAGIAIPPGCFFGAIPSELAFVGEIVNIIRIENGFFLRDRRLFSPIFACKMLQP
jgi:hypothetical protein